jgi:uncharacterized cupredoxin-like copper-binding protein
VVRTAALLALVATALTLNACGSSDGGTSTTTSQAQSKAEKRRAYLKEHPGTAEYGSPPLEFEADPNGKLAYTKDVVTAKEGNVVIEFTNPQSTPHNVAIKAAKQNGLSETKTISDGFTAEHTLTLYANEKYIFFCTIPGHREAGMEGVLKVLPR